MIQYLQYNPLIENNNSILLLSVFKEWPLLWHTIGTKVAMEKVRKGLISPLNVRYLVVHHRDNQDWIYWTDYTDDGILTFHNVQGSMTTSVSLPIASRTPENPDAVTVQYTTSDTSQSSNTSAPPYTNDKVNMTKEDLVADNSLDSTVDTVFAGTDSNPNVLATWLTTGDTDPQKPGKMAPTATYPDTHKNMSDTSSPLLTPRALPHLGDHNNSPIYKMSLPPSTTSST